MTQLALNEGFAFVEPNRVNNGGQIRARNDLMIAAAAHLTDRANLNEFYTKDYEDHLNSAQANRDEAKNGFVRADYIHLSFLRLRLDNAAPMRGGGKWKQLCKDNLYSLDEKNSNVDCVFMAMQQQFGMPEQGKRVQVPPIRDSIAQIRQKSGVPPSGGISLDDLSIIEENYSWSSQRQQHNSLVRKLRFMVFDLRFNLRRLPKYKEPDGKSGHNTDFCYIVMHCGHAYAFRCRNFAAQRCRESLSWYKSCVQVGTGEYEKRGKGAGPKPTQRAR